jgi:hypothetical protein
VDIPRIWVCILPAHPIAHKSELLEFIEGEIALGGLVRIRVSVSVEVVTVELLVDSVTIGSAITGRTNIIQKTTTINPAIILFRSLLDIYPVGSAAAI